jgi:hypothetical protein
VRVVRDDGERTTALDLQNARQESGGPLAFVRTGDRIRISVADRGSIFWWMKWSWRSAAKPQSLLPLFHLEATRASSTVKIFWQTRVATSAA